MNGTATGDLGEVAQITKWFRKRRKDRDHRQSTDSDWDLRSPQWENFYDGNRNRADEDRADADYSPWRPPEG